MRTNRPLSVWRRRPLGGPARCSLPSAKAAGGDRLAAAVTPARAARGLAAALCGLTLLGSGCATLVAQAPFTERPDTTAKGSLIGPFDGQVIDQATGNPIAGALVLGTWAFERESGLATPDAAHAEVTQTQSDGTYVLPAIPATRRKSSLLRRFSIVIYKAGYLGYRSDIRFEDRTPRHDFAQHQNKARLDRFPEGESHAQHLVFLGGGAELRRSAQAEIVQATLELVERGAKLEPAQPQSKEQTTPEAPPPKNPLDGSIAARLLTQADIDGLSSGAASTYTAAPLPDTRADAALGPGFDSVHYRASDQAETRDAALRLWRTTSSKEADALWKKVRAQLAGSILREGSSPGTAPKLTAPAARASEPPIAEVPEVTTPLRDGEGAQHALPAAPDKREPAPLKLDGSVVAFDPKLRVYGVALVTRRLGLVLKLTCGAELCPTADGAVQLMARVLGRL